MNTDIHRGEGHPERERRDLGDEPHRTPLASDIASELDTLLAIIQMNAQVGLEIGPPEMSELFGDLMAACRRGAALSERLSRSTPSAASERGPVDVAELIRDVRPTIRDLLGNGIECDVCEELTHSPVVLAERDELEHLFFRVAAEARRAMPQGGTLRVSLRDESVGRVRLVFTALAPASTLAPNGFFSLEPTPTTPTGLVSARNTVELWGGSVHRCESRVPSVALELLRVAQRTERLAGPRMENACGRDAGEVLAGPERRLLPSDEETCREGVSPYCSSMSSTPSSSTAPDR